MQGKLLFLSPKSQSHFHEEKKKKKKKKEKENKQTDINKLTIFTLALKHLVYSPKSCITIVFDPSWDNCNTQEKLETLVMQNFGG